jgi:Zn-dependent protease with chaperone function
MRGARSLYLVHIATAGFAVLLVALAATFALSGSSFALPSGSEIATACGDWLSSGGPAALLSLLIVGLAAGIFFLTARSLVRQLLAGRQYLRALPLGETVPVDDLQCRTIETSERAAFCAGYLRPRVYLSRGILEELDHDELRAVVAHERHHLGRRDPLRRLVARALAEGLFFLPILGRTSRRYVDLGELAADQAAVTALDDRRPLARALLKLSEHDPMPHAVAGIDPARVDYLLGDTEANRWRLPRTAAGRSALAVGGLGGLLVLSILVRPEPGIALLLAAGCMVAMVGGPIALAAAALTAARRTPAASRPPTSSEQL